jgi:hypothetical protein
MQSTAPVMSVADQAAHSAASFVRPFLSPVGEQALSRLEACTAGWFPAAAGDHPPQEDEALRRVREHRDALRAGLAEYHEYAASIAA